MRDQVQMRLSMLVQFHGKQPYARCDAPDTIRHMRRLLAVSDLYLDSANLSAGALARLPVPRCASCCAWESGAGTMTGALVLRTWTLVALADSALAACAARFLALAPTARSASGPVCQGCRRICRTARQPAPRMAELQDTFAQEFGATDQRLHAAGDGLLLESPVAAAASAPDPARLLGNVLEIRPAHGTAQRALRRLGVEVEMWLSGLPLNRDRERRGEPVTALWFSGGGSGLPEQAPGRRTVAAADRPWLHGFWSMVGDQPGSGAARDAMLGDSALAVVSAVRCQSRDDAAAASLERLESDWFAPALRDLRAGRISAMRLRIGGRGWELPSRPRLRWWRRTRPWWQVVAA
jgi:hypothetical protein